MENHTIIVIIICCVVALLLAFFAWKLAQKKVHSASIKKRRKRLLILLCIYIFILLLLMAFAFVIHENMSEAIEFLKETFFNRGFIGMTIVFFTNLIYAYFRKEKTPKEKEIAEEQVNK